MSSRERASEDALLSRDAGALSASVYLGRGLKVAEELVKSLTARGRMIAAAESCTAGLASDFIARIPGASKVLWGSFVVYTSDAKQRMLGVPGELLEKHGPVSRLVALSMAEEALKKSNASWAFSVTGLAGPGGDGAPIGTVWTGIAGWNSLSGNALDPVWSEAKMFLFTGNRNEVREAAAVAVLEELLDLVGR